MSILISVMWGNSRGVVGPMMVGDRRASTLLHQIVDDDRCNDNCERDVFMLANLLYILSFITFLFLANTLYL